MIAVGATQGVDSLRRVVEQVMGSPVYQWVERPDPWRYLKELRLAVVRWLNELAVEHPQLERAFLITLVVILVAVVVHAVWVMVATTRTGRASLATPDTSALRSGAWYRAEADRLAAEGRYPEAIQADFLALVVALDARQQVRFHPSKTPAEYLAELPWQDARREEFRGLVHSLYGYAFARYPCTRDHFEQWRLRAAPDRYAAIG